MIIVKSNNSDLCSTLFIATANLHIPRGIPLQCEQNAAAAFRGGIPQR